MKDFASMTDAELMAAYKATKGTSTPADFAEAYGPAATKAAAKLGVDPQVLLGQWGLETGWGKSIIPGTHNLGNIKDFSGAGTAATDNMTGSRDKYRTYASPDAFADDYSDLISRKYPGAVGAKTPEQFAAALKAGGYAEDPNYAAKVVKATQMTQPKGLIQRGVEAVIPSANAAEPAASPYGGMSDEELLAAYQKLKGAPPAQPAAEGPGLAKRIVSGSQEAFADLGKGFVRGAAGIGNTIINSGTKAGADALAGIDDPNGLIDPKFKRGAAGVSPVERQNVERQQGLKAYDAQAPKSLAFGAGKLAAEVAGTAGVGGAIAAPLKAVAPAVSMAAPAAGNVLSKFATAVGSGGMTVGGAPATTAAQGAGNLLLRAAGGAVNGGASAGLIDPETAGTGALIGGAFPVATKAAGTVGKAIGRTVAGKAIAPEVKALADRASQLGIDIPADRLVNSKPLNALASSLDYVPGSGRAATMDKMNSQLNTALSKTFGQNSDNVTAALRKAQTDLGGKFDTVLKSNTVKVDQQFMTDLADAANMASRELGSDGAGIISKQVDDILDKAATGQIDGQAAYNIKRTLDRISNRSTPEAYYARELKKKLMEALDRSLGPTEAAAFATVRKQYSNMLSLENLAQNGAEGNISIARLANMKNINNPELQELADISAQFLKSREGAHGAAQRVGAGALALGLTGPQGLAAGMATGRGANMLLNSSMMKNAVTGTPQTNGLLQFARSPEVEQLLYRGAPVAGSQ